VTIRVGIDVGGTKCLAVAIDDDARPRSTERRPTPQALGDFVDTLAEIATLVAPAGTPVGIGLPGLVDRGGVLRGAPHLPAVVGAPVAEMLADRLSTTVVMDNDNTCAGLAEASIGAAAGEREVLYVGLGTGIGGAMVSGGVLRRGTNGFAGEIGHMVVRADGERCACGQRGCWELTASGTALRTAAAAAGFDDGGGVLVSPEPAAQAIVEWFASEVALGLVNLVNVLDPGVIVIGGGVIEHGERLVGPVRAALVRGLYGSDHRPIPDVRAAALGPVAPAIGAALMA
jgi:glucokinase